MPLNENERKEFNRLEREIEIAELEVDIALSEAGNQLQPQPAASTAVASNIGRPEPQSAISRLSGTIDEFALSKPSKHQELGPLINLLKEVIRFPKEQIFDPVLSPAAKSLTTGGPSDLVEALTGTARTAEGIARFIPAVGRDVLNVTGAGIPTPPLIGEQATEENFERPTAREAEEKLRDAPLGLTLGALGVSSLLKPKPSAIEATVKSATKSKAFAKDVPLAKTARAGIEAQIKTDFNKITERSTQDLKPETPELSYAKALDNTLKQDVFAKPEKATDLYPLVKESAVYPKSKKFKPATDGQLKAFAQAGSEEWAGMTKPDKSIVRKEYSRQRRLQKNEMAQDRRNRLEFDIEPDPVMREKLKQRPPEVKDLSELKDVSVVETTIIPKDPERMIEKTLPKKIGDDLIGRRDKAKADYTDWVIDRETKHVEFTEKLGIKPGSKLDKSVQLFGEGDLSVQQITKRHGAKGAEKIVKAAEWYREQYEGLLKEYNSAMANIFPGDRSKLVSRRKDYFRHFRELGDLSRLLDIVEEPGGLLNAPSNVLGFLKPAGKKPGFIRRRLGGKTDISASAGYADYIQQAGYGINITPMTQYWRRFANQLDASALAGKGEIPRFRSQLQTTINNMTGMPNAIDAWFSEHLGKGWDIMQIANRRAKQNIILGNVGSVLAQPFNIPQAIAKMGSPSFAKGASFTLGDIFTKGELSRPMRMDAWMRER